MRKSRPKTNNLAKPCLVAEPAGFPGVRIPLLSDEECKARGIQKAKLPPFDTWSPEQQEAGRKLAEALLNLALPQALQLMLEEIERLPPDTVINEADIELLAATRGIARIDAGSWKPGAKETHGLDTYVRQILEWFAKREVSLLNPTAKYSKVRVGSKKKRDR
jgi:hypothetical protein